MDRLLIQLLQSKAFQGLGVGVGVVFLVIYVAPPIFRKPIIVIFCALLLIIAGYNLFLKGMKAKKSMSFEKGLSKDMGSGAKGGSVTARKAQSEVAVRWNAAAAEIKKSGMDLYTLPWYLLIGEPQSGKSTTLRNSGLEFPVGTEALSGAGGTRNCDWWFTNEAIVLDTAGRFTFQEKNAPDEGEWKTFLGMLKKRRARCPINGVLLVIPCSSLLGDSEEVREQKAVNIREKLTQLQRDLEIQFPVFVLVTKCDQILGFTEFFARLPAADQRQILGWSMHGPFIQAYDPAKFPEYFDSVASRIHKVRLKLLSEDNDLNLVDKFFGFPEEFKSIREPLRDYLKTIFVRTHYLPPLFFRGFYFTSGLQEGRPIAKACAAMLRNAGPGADEIVEELVKAFAKSKAFFIQHFYQDKLFPEKSMVIHSVKRLGLFQKLGWALTAASALLLVATGGLMYWSFKGLNERIVKLGTSIDAVSTDFKNAAIRNRDFLSRGEVPPAPETGGIASAALANAQAFSAEMKKPDVKDLGLDKELAEIHWLYMMHNVVFPQSCYLYGAINQATSGEGAGSSVKEPTMTKYAQYARLWSLNDEWLRRTRDAGGAQGIPPDLKWEAFFPDGKMEDFVGDRKIRDIFGEQIALASETLKTQGLKVDKTGFPLKEDGTTDESKFRELKEKGDLGDDPPIEIWMAPGPLNPRENEPIKREIEKAGEFQKMSDAMIDEIIGKARGAKEAIDQLKDGAFFNAKWCSINPAENNPFGETAKAAEGIETSIAALQKALDDHKGEIADAASMGNKDNIRKKYEALGWIGSSFGEPGFQLKKFVDAKVDEIATKMGGEGAEHLNKLRKDEFLKIFLSLESLDLNSRTMELRKEALELAKGIGVYRRFVEAQNKLIKDIAANNVPGIGKFDKLAVIDQVTKGTWPATPELKEAQIWTGSNPRKEGPIPPDTATIEGKIQALSGFISDTIMYGEEAIWVEAYLQYLKTQNMYAGVVSESDIANASLSKVPGKDDAFNKDVFLETNKNLDKLIEEMGGFAKGIKCPDSKSRMESELAKLNDIKKSTRGKFEKYWASAFDRWSPYAWISNYSKGQWSSFWGDPLFQKGEIVTRAQKELELFNIHISGIGGSQNYPKMEKDIAAFLDSNSKAGDAAADFAKAVVEMGQDEAKAAFVLEKFEKRLDPIANILGGGSGGAKFAKYPDKVRELLGDRFAYFVDALADFLRKWEPELADKFPFKYDKSVADALSVGTTEITVPQAKAKSFLAFSAGERSLKTFLAQPSFAEIYPEWAKKEANAAPKRFIDNCLKMSDFFVAGDDFKLQEIKGTFTGFSKGKAKLKMDDLRKIAEDIYLHLPDVGDTVENKWRARMDMGKTFPVKWKPGEYTKEEQFRFESVYDVPDNPSDKNRAGLRVAGDFGILAYIDKYGTPETRQKWRNILFKVAPQFATKPAKQVVEDEVYAITFNFDMPQPLPELPDWADVRPLMQK